MDEKGTDGGQDEMTAIWSFAKGDRGENEQVCHSRRMKTMKKGSEGLQRKNPRPLDVVSAKMTSTINDSIP